MVKHDVAIAFPGQGIQKPGMASPIIDSAAWRLFDEASELVNYDLGKLVLNGPAEALNNTAYAQVAIFVTCFALWELNKERFEPSIFLGHSLGEITALAAAGALTFTDAVRLVQARGDIMTESIPGGMVAIIGLDSTSIHELCVKEQARRFVQISNENSPAQTVVSGTVEGLELLANLARENGAKRVVPLNVSGPFHSRLMEPAAEKFSLVVEQLNLSPCHVPVLSNDGETLLHTPEMIRSELVAQLTSPVRFTQAVHKLAELGIKEFIEVSPESVLISLARRTEGNLQFTLVSNGGI